MHADIRKHLAFSGPPLLHLSWFSGLGFHWPFSHPYRRDGHTIWDFRGQLQFMTFSQNSLSFLPILSPTVYTSFSHSRLLKLYILTLFLPIFYCPSWVEREKLLTPNFNFRILTFNSEFEFEFDFNSECEFENDYTNNSHLILRREKKSNAIDKILY